MAAEQFRTRLKQEFDARRQKNPRYSLRAFATFLAIDHSTLSQVLRGRRPIPARQLRQWGRKLGMGAEEITAYVAAQHVADPPTIARQEQLRHWTAEAMAIVADHTHWQILRLSHSRGFQADCRWIAVKIGTTVDQVNLALSRLLRLRLLEIPPTGRWKDLMGHGSRTEEEFQKHALTQVRKLAAESGVELRKPRTTSGTPRMERNSTWATR